VPRHPVFTPHAPSHSLYSQGVKAGPFIYISGMAGIDTEIGGLAGETIQAQTKEAIKNCSAILYAADASLDDVVEVGILLANPADFAGMNEAYAPWFPVDPPTRYVAKLGVDLPGILVSIRMTAYVGN
jgi:2-iminobutanoate/2-iminopropanoate deaminase